MYIYIYMYLYIHIYIYKLLGDRIFRENPYTGKGAGLQVGRSNRNLELWAQQTSSLHPRSLWSLRRYYFYYYYHYCYYYYYYCY